MSNTKMPNDLQALWDELTKSDDVRRKRIRKKRFDERAAQYAQPSQEEQTYLDEEVFKLLTFRLADERYGVDVQVVQNVRPAESITRIPAVPAFYRGVINVRGRIVSVLDLRLFLGLAPSDAASSELVLVHRQELFVALLADRIEEVQVIPRATVEPVDMRYAHGVTASHLVILDIDYLLSDERLIIRGDQQT